MKAKKKGAESLSSPTAKKRKVSVSSSIAEDLVSGKPLGLGRCFGFIYFVSKYDFFMD